MAIKTEDFINDLIENSNDIQKNLFEVIIMNDQDTDFPTSAIKFRTSTFNAPGLSINTIPIQYWNTQLPIPIASHNDSKELQFSIRLDSDYKVYTALKDKLYVTRNGKWEYDPVKNSFVIAVKALKIVNNGYEYSHKWEFIKCFVKDIPQIQFSYNDSGTEPIVITFVYGFYTEENVNS